MLDARFLIDVHFRQGEKKDKDNFPSVAEASETGKNTQPNGRAYTRQSEEWHAEEERLGGAGAAPIRGEEKKKTGCH